MRSRKKPGAINLGQLLPILFTLALLIGVIVMKSRCGSAVGNIFKAIDAPARSDAGSP
jgi:hypothetical protein